MNDAFPATFSFQHREPGIQEGSRFERSWSPPLGDKGWGGIGFQQLLRIVSPRDCRREDSAAGSGSRGVMDATIQIPRSWNLISGRRRRRRRNGYFELLRKMARWELIVSRVMENLACEVEQWMDRRGSLNYFLNYNIQNLRNENSN